MTMEEVANEGIVKDSTVEITLTCQGSEPINQSIGEFRHDFAALLERLEIRALVAFIKVMDRCMPENILDTGEALRFFLPHQRQRSPRQIKRFVNTLVLRRGLAQARGIVLDDVVLARLVILEYMYEAFFSQLCQ